MIYRKAALTVAAIPLLLTGCSTSDTAENIATVTATSTVTTTAQSDEEKVRQALERIAPEAQLSADNLSNQCILAIDDYLRDAGNFDITEPITLKPTTPEKTAYAGGGTFQYQNAQDEWVDATYYCRIHTEGGIITDAYASVSSL